jgi:hypothetical protein
MYDGRRNGQWALAFHSPLEDRLPDSWDALENGFINGNGLEGPDEFVSIWGSYYVGRWVGE